MCDHNDKIHRPVHRSDIVVIFTEFIFNIFQVFTAFWESFYELSMYHAKRNAEVNKVWEDFNNDLETLPEDTNGAS